MNAIKRIRKSEMQNEARSTGNSQKIQGLPGGHQQQEDTDGF